MKLRFETDDQVEVPLHGLRRDLAAALVREHEGDAAEALIDLASGIARRVEVLTDFDLSDVSPANAEFARVDVTQAIALLQEFERRLQSIRSP